MLHPQKPVTLDLLWPRQQVIFQVAVCPVTAQHLSHPPEGCFCWSAEEMGSSFRGCLKWTASGVNIQGRQEDTCTYTEEEGNRQQRCSWWGFKPTSSPSARSHPITVSGKHRWSPVKSRPLFLLFLSAHSCSGQDLRIAFMRINSRECLWVITMSVCVTCGAPVRT